MTKSEINSRPSYEETILKLISNPDYAKLSFYGFILAKCKVVFNDAVPTLGVSFDKTTYTLVIGRQFKDWTLDQRIAVLIHETKHILGGHVFRKGERNHEMFNVATDIAINQTIDNLPGFALMPAKFDFPEGQTAEVYYELLKREQEKQEKEKEDFKDEHKDEPQNQKEEEKEEEKEEKEEEKEKEEEEEKEECEDESKDCDNKCDNKCDNPGDSNPDDKADEGEGQEGDETEGEDGEGQEGEAGSGSGENGEPSESAKSKPTKPEIVDKDGKSWSPSDGHPDITEQEELEEITLDTHADWTDSGDINEDLARSVTEAMIKSAMTQSRGNTPGDIVDLLELWKRKAKISWKKELRNYLSSKAGKRISTIKRRDRRFPNRRELRGKKRHTDNHIVVVGVDTSGSMSDQQILEGLIEIYEVAKVNGSELQVIQIDTEIKTIQEFGTKDKTFKRHGYGGTYMGAIVPFIQERDLKPDVLIMISDMYIEDVSSDANWSKFKTPTIWLSTSGEIPSWKKKMHKIIDIKNA